MYFPPNPLPNPKSGAGKRALDLYTAAQEAAKRPVEARDAATAAVSAHTAAKAAYHAELTRSATEGARDPEREAELTAEVATTAVAADPQAIAIRERTARDTHQRAIAAWHSFVQDNLKALIADELAPEAEKVAAEYQAAIAKVEPIREKYLAVAQRVANLTSVVAGSDPAKLALWAQAQEPEAPLPARHLWDAEAPTPERPAEPEPVLIGRQRVQGVWSE